MAKYDTFSEYLATLDNHDHVRKLSDLTHWIHHTFPTLELRIAWNQPMLTDHGTFIIGFSVAKNYLSVAVEAETLDHFRDQIEAAGYTTTKKLFHLPWDQVWPQDLLAAIIQHTQVVKQDITTFWG